MSNGEDKNSIISTQIISASLTMITVIAAFAVFIIEKRKIDFWYYLVAGLAFLLFVTSIFLGGRGLSGKAAAKRPNPYFNWQAITALLGVVLFCVSVFCAKEKPDELEAKVNDQEKTIVELKTKDEFRAKEVQRLTSDIDKLTKQIKDIKSSTYSRSQVERPPKRQNSLFQKKTIGSHFSTAVGVPLQQRREGNQPGSRYKKHGVTKYWKR